MVTCYIHCVYFFGFFCYRRVLLQTQITSETYSNNNFGQTDFSNDEMFPNMNLFLYLTMMMMTEPLWIPNEM